MLSPLSRSLFSIARSRSEEMSGVNDISMTILDITTPLASSSSTNRAWTTISEEESHSGPSLASLASMCGDNHLAKQLKQYVKCHQMRCGTADLVHAHYIITSRGGKNDPFSRVDKEGRKPLSLIARITV